MQGGLTALQAPAPVTGPRDSLTAVWLLAIRYPARGASTTLAVPDPDVAPGTGCQAPVPATADVSWYEEQPVEPPSEVDRGSPEQRAKTANARSPTASRLMTCSPPVWTCCHVCPPSRVHHNSGPKTHPSSRLRKRTWLTPAPLLASPVGGAGTLYVQPGEEAAVDRALGVLRDAALVEFNVAIRGCGSPGVR